MYDDSPWIQSKINDICTMEKRVTINIATLIENSYHIFLLVDKPVKANNTTLTLPRTIKYGKSTLAEGFQCTIAEVSTCTSNKIINYFILDSTLKSSIYYLTLSIICDKTLPSQIECFRLITGNFSVSLVIDGSPLCLATSPRRPIV